MERDLVAFACTGRLRAEGSDVRQGQARWVQGARQAQAQQGGGWPPGPSSPSEGGGDGVFVAFPPLREREFESNLVPLGKDTCVPGKDAFFLGRTRVFLGGTRIPLERTHVFLARTRE